MYIYILDDLFAVASIQMAVPLEIPPSVMAMASEISGDFYGIIRYTYLVISMVKYLVIHSIDGFISTYNIL